jgi:hypothetical protein
MIPHDESRGPSPQWREYQECVELMFSFPQLQRRNILGRAFSARILAFEGLSRARRSA